MKFTFINSYTQDKFFKGLSLVSSILTIILLFGTPDILQECTVFCKYFVIFLLFAMPVVYSLTSWHCRKRFSIPVVGEKYINVLSGDLFNQKGIIVIPVNSAFDTIVDNRIIAESTVHGSFINKFFKNNTHRLDLEIKQQLANCGITPVKQNKAGNCEKYPLGTIVEIPCGEVKAVLVAITDFDDDNHIIDNPEGYFQALFRLFQYICKCSQALPVYMPLIGLGISKVAMSSEDSIRNVVQVVRSLHMNLPVEISIVVLPKEFPKVNKDFE
ncbi:hypothetical protein SAMN02745671_02721 [Anaerovibrio lipolyticus DSM 3074]|nr:macro domain-containing protein [Anaerovibrio lipolyticus]SHJ11565.1 hypothetical protein SAMN02745671_02721 [Anaerovibrio lipolyticus DSM 3074]